MKSSDSFRPVAGHSLGDDFCVLASSPLLVNNVTGALAQVASFNGDSVWLVHENGTKNNYSLATYDALFDDLEDPHGALCVHCGFLEVAHGESLCENCRER